MPSHRRNTIVVLTAASLLAGGAVFMIQNERVAADTAAQQHAHDHGGPGFGDIRNAVAVLHPTEDNEASGIVRLMDHGNHVHILARVEGLEPNGTHGFHIHEFGDCTAPDATSAGGHYNPEGHPHGLPNDEERHAGDLGNLEADSEGVAELRLTVDNVSVAGEHNPALGRGVIVHESDDDGSQPLGDAGPRIACGVIGVAQTDN